MPATCRSKRSRRISGTEKGLYTALPLFYYRAQGGEMDQLLQGHWKREETRMRSMFSIVILILVIMTCVPVDGITEEKPVQLSLFTPLQIFPEETSIKYFRFNLIYGRNASFTGLDLGLVNHLTSGESRGVQLGFANWVDADLKGLQYGWLNATKGTFTGWQWGFVNYSGHTKGFMLGLVNYSETMYGLQIGLINIIREGGMLPFFPIFNFSF
jgi:hypothetical protein